MKKVLFSFAFAIWAITSFGQTLLKGNLLGLHTSTPTLKDGISMKDYIKFYTGKVIPKYEEAFPGMKMYLIKSLRGQDSSSIGVIFLFNRETDRNKYFNNDGTMTKLGGKVTAKLSDLQKEFDKYVISNAPDKYNDWLVE